jgi:proteasome lid subunit RPN8/RPN11
MLQGLVTSASHLLDDLRRSLLVPSVSAPSSSPSGSGAPFVPLQRVLLTDGVGRTLFEGYARHRDEEHGDEETGWLLLGLREANEAVALATLPAGMQSDAGVAHILFNSTAQAVGSRIVRQFDRRLVPLGVVHTHPGSLRHPSDGDLRGDRDWVQCLRGREGVFAIGTADGPHGPNVMFASRPHPNVQCLGKLRFSWYSLREGESSYRPLPVELTLGPDLARNLHLVWPILEAHADRIERLMAQQAGVKVEVADDKGKPALLLILPLAGKEGSLRVLLGDSEVRYLLERNGELHETTHHEDLVDRGVYLLLAQLAEEA